MNHFSVKGLALLKSLEGFRATAYDDQTGANTGKWINGATIGYGHLIGEDEWDS